MRSYLIVVLVAVLGLAFLSCSGSKVLTDTKLGDVPDWFKNIPEDPDFLFSAKTATSKDLQLALDKATQAARADIAQQAEVKISGIQKSFQEEVGAGDESELLQQFTQASKSVFSTQLVGSKTKEQKLVKDGQGYRAYVLVEYPVGAAAQALMQQLSKKKNLYTRFRASQTFEELNKEVEKYEKWKKEQGMQ